VEPEFVSALIGGGVGALATILVTGWSSRSAKKLAHSMSEREHRRFRLEKASMVCAWVGPSSTAAKDFIAMPHVINRSGSAIYSVKVEFTLLTGLLISDTDVVDVATRRFTVVPPIDTPTLGDRLPHGFAGVLNSTSEDDPSMFYVATTEFTDAIGDSWLISETGEVSLVKTAEQADAELLGLVEGDP